MWVTLNGDATTNKQFEVLIYGGSTYSQNNNQLFPVNLKATLIVKSTQWVDEGEPNNLQITFLSRKAVQQSSLME